ncbi:hypothetical protein Bbelb_347430 [Branchiostoma belcheri]|nr:hypothetical protein Bbelb_347430 [Branchiostoma belcheri]
MGDRDCRAAILTRGQGCQHSASSAMASWLLVALLSGMVVSNSLSAADTFTPPPDPSFQPADFTDQSADATFDTGTDNREDTKDVFLAAIKSPSQTPILMQASEKNKAGRKQQGKDECTRNPCQHGTCVCTCTCSPGWTGQNCQQDIDECSGNPCEHGRCVNQDGGYNCNCSPGWTGQHCQHDIDECIWKPCEYGTCVNQDGGYNCTCSPGYTGQNCQQGIDACIKNPCQHGHCVSIDDGYSCMCLPGWTGKNCQQDIDECSTNPCQHGRCVNQDGGYNCNCSPGWTGQNCQQGEIFAKKGPKVLYPFHVLSKEWPVPSAVGHGTRVPLIGRVTFGGSTEISSSWSNEADEAIATKKKLPLPPEVERKVWRQTDHVTEDGGAHPTELARGRAAVVVGVERVLARQQVKQVRAQFKTTQTPELAMQDLVAATTQLTNIVTECCSAVEKLGERVTSLETPSGSDTNTVIRAHGLEETATDLYRKLSIGCQEEGESSQGFVTRMMGLRDKVVEASKEEDGLYDAKLVQAMFLRSVWGREGNNHIARWCRTQTRTKKGNASGAPQGDEGSS